MKTTILGIGNAGSNIAKSIRKNSNNIEFKEARYIFADCSETDLNRINDGETVLLNEEMQAFPMDSLQGTERLVVIAGLGGKVGTKFSELAVIAAKELGVESVYVAATIPFAFEGKQRVERSVETAKRLATIEKISLSIFQNGSLVEKHSNQNFFNAFEYADKEMVEMVENIIENK